MNTHTETINYTERAKKLQELTKLIEEKTDIFITDFLDEQEIEEMFDDSWNADTLFNRLDRNQAFNIEIIYYYNAMQYLSQHDNSLIESLELAWNMGFGLKGLSSETLASLHASQKAMDDYYNITDEIDEILSR